MKAEFSNYGFINAKRYTSLHLQEGRMVTDRDEMGSKAMLQAAQQALGKVTFRNGVPKHDGLLTNFTQSTARLAPKGGKVVAGGLVAHIEPGNSGQDLSFSNQRDLPEMDFDGGFLYVDIFKDSISALEDPDLLDVALHGADTSVAERMYSQIKCCKIDAVIQSDCGSVFDPEKMPEIGTGEFSIQLRDTATSPDQCDPCAAEVTIGQDVLNALFRMEVHSVDYDELGMPLSVTLKWSYENAGMIFPTTATQDIQNSNFSFEYFEPDTQSQMGIPAQGYGVAGPMRIAHGSDNSTPSINPQTLVRRLDGFAVIDLVTFTVEGWDKDQDLNSGTSARSVTKSPDGYVFNLETVTVTLKLDSKAILAGDYWLALLRSNTSSDADAVRALSTLPMGIKHEYCLLGYSEDGINLTEISTMDMNRLQSPDLSCLDAGDIRYAPKNECDYSDGATNVQDALDAFCKHIGNLFEADQSVTAYPYITGIRYALDNSAYQNDAQTYSDRLASGLIFEFSEPMRVDIIGDEQIRFFMEYLYGVDNVPTQTQAVRELIIPGVVRGSPDERSVTFIPDFQRLRAAIDQAASTGVNNIRCRIEILGEFILSKAGRPCDAQIPGRIVSERIDDLLVASDAAKDANDVPEIVTGSDSGVVTNEQVSKGRAEVRKPTGSFT